MTIERVRLHKTKPIDLIMNALNSRPGRRRQYLGIDLQNQLLMSSYLDMKAVVGGTSSVTLFGLVTYDSATDSTKMTHLTNIFAGSFNEVCRLIEEEATRCRGYSNQLYLLVFFCAFLGVLSFSIGTARLENHLWRQLRGYFRRREREQACKVSDLEGTRGVPECAICMDNVATVVLTPCNHLVMCTPCLQDIKEELGEETPCPLCRRSVDYS